MVPEEEISWTPKKLKSQHDLNRSIANNHCNGHGAQSNPERGQSGAKIQGVESINWETSPTIQVFPAMRMTIHLKPPQPQSETHQALIEAQKLGRRCGAGRGRSRGGAGLISPVKTRLAYSSLR